LNIISIGPGPNTGCFFPERFGGLRILILNPKGCDEVDVKEQYRPQIEAFKLLIEATDTEFRKEQVMRLRQIAGQSGDVFTAFQRYVKELDCAKLSAQLQNPECVIAANDAALAIAKTSLRTELLKLDVRISQTGAPLSEKAGLLAIFLADLADQIEGNPETTVQ